jgi:hypothetical protein
VSDHEAEFREFVGAQMESLRGLASLENHNSYARTAVVRAAIDEMRRPWWHREQSHGDALPDRPAPEVIPSVDDRVQLRQALRQVPMKHRAVLVLRFLEGLSVPQTAAALRCPEGTVKAYTSRRLSIQTVVPPGGMVIDYMAGGRGGITATPTCRSKDEGRAAASARSFGPSHNPGSWRPTVESFPTSAQLSPG